MHVYSFVSFLAVGGFIFDLYVSAFGFQIPGDQLMAQEITTSIIGVLISDRTLIWLVILLVLIGWGDIKRNLQYQNVMLAKNTRLMALDVARKREAGSSDGGMNDTELNQEGQ